MSVPAPSTAAQRFLNLIQEQQHAALGLRPRRYDEEFLRGLIRRQVAAENPTLGEQEREALVAETTVREFARANRRPSVYQDPFQYNIISSLAQKIEDAADALEIDIPHRPILGTIPLPQVNALTLLVPGSPEHLVLFTSEMTTFALLLSKAVAQAFPLVQSDVDGMVSFASDSGRIREHVAADPTIRQRFIEVVTAYCLTGQPGAAPQYFAQGMHSTLAGILRESMELFILGHEYGHLIHGHLTDAARSSTLLPATDAEALDYSWNQEHEADVTGALLAVTAMRRSGYDDALSYWGCDLFFSAMDVMDRAVSLLRFGAEDRFVLGSHPPSSVRRTVLRAFMRTLYQDQDQDAYESAIHLGGAVEETVDLLWGLTRPVIGRLHAQGAPVADIWRTVTDPG